MDTKDYKFFHGIMFHHFHDDKDYLKSQGSISKDDLVNLIKFVGRKNILDADDFIDRLKRKKLSTNNVCFTFDDSLKCQYSVALPILEEMKIKAFFFVYSSIFTSKPDMLEIYRYFRMNYYKSMDEFYNKFFKIFSESRGIKLEKVFEKKKNLINDLIKQYPVYSYNDSKFRLLRDNIMSKHEYDQIMLNMIEEKKFDYKQMLKKIFLTKKDLKQLSIYNHFIGLHSHSHFTNLKQLNYNEQYKEYQKNFSILSKIINNRKIISMSHPLGLYNNNILEILEKLGIEIGFRDNMQINSQMNKINNSKYEIAREDHSNIMKMMN